MSKEILDDSIVKKVLAGVSHSVDFICPPLSAIIMTRVKKFFGVVNPGIRTRTIFTGPISSFEKLSSRHMNEMLALGWQIKLIEESFIHPETRITPVVPSATAIIMDGRDAIIIDRATDQYTNLAYTHLTTSTEVAFLQEHFDLLWRGEDRNVDRDFTLLHENLIRFELPEYQSEVLTYSNGLWDELIKCLSHNPEQLYSLNPRKFEELVAELLIRQGLEVHITPQSKDGGYDIMAFSHTHLGQLLFLVECKRYAKDKPVGVEIINALYGIVEKEKATAGVLVTTSRFTSGVVKTQKQLGHRLALKDYHDLCKWLEISHKESAV